MKKEITEKFQPLPNTAPDSFPGKIKYFLRMIFDLQYHTIIRSAQKELPTYKGTVLDVGCGHSPYQFLLKNDQIKYYGIDIDDAHKFGYNNSQITSFNGEDIPFEANLFNAIICTEVLEHVANYQKLVDEIYRVMKPGATGIVTIPWSARYHYMPYDYFRYTPSSLKIMFSKFSSHEIIPRGTDISTVCAKIIVLYFRNLMPAERWKMIFAPILLCLSPFLAVTVVVAHLALIFNLGSDEDPLGYTVLIKK